MVFKAMCPKCGRTVSRKYKIKNCPNCGYKYEKKDEDQILIGLR